MKQLLSLGMENTHFNFKLENTQLSNILHVQVNCEGLTCDFVCLSHSRIFHSYGDVTITTEGLLILTYTRHSWQLSSEGSLACHLL